MAYDKVVDSAALDAALGGIADAIRAQTGGAELLSLEEMAAAVGGIKNADDYLAVVLNRQVVALVNHQITAVLPTNFQKGNKSLVAADLPNVTGLGEGVFADCTNLTDVNLASSKTMASSCFSSTKALNTAYFPETETITGWGYSFSNSAVEKVVFLKLTSQLGDRDFNNCGNLKALVLGANTVVPLTKTTAFLNTPIANGTGYIYVPRGQLNAYKAATNWSTLAAQFRAIEDYPGITEV